MITNFKLFETLSKPLIAEIAEHIRDDAKEYTFQNIDLGNLNDIDDCPFAAEIAIIHQKDYIDDIFWNSTDLPEDISLKDFTSVYNMLLQKAKTTILNSVMNNPKLYDDWEEWIDEDFVEIPDWVISASKYNL